MKLIPEWYEHQYCLIAWPCNKDLYGKIINKARDEVANVINEIAKTEHVIVLSNKEDINEIENKTDQKNINIVECKLDDSWMRDIAPIFYNEDEKLKSISFEFNGYGKYPDYLNDNKISKFISNYLNIPTKISDLVIEGGAITYDDKKNLIGVVTSGTMSPSLEKSIALAIIDIEKLDKTKNLFVSIRKKFIKAKKINYPFYEKK